MTVMGGMGMGVGIICTEFQSINNIGLVSLVFMITMQEQI